MAAWCRTLAGKMLGKKVQVEADKQRAQAEAAAASTAAQEARFELARRLTEVPFPASPVIILKLA